MPTLAINNADFYYELHGKGLPLVLIAGYTVDHRAWFPIIEALATHYQVLIFDNRGVGLTKDEGLELNANLMANDVAAIIKELRLTKPYVLGHSMGGTIAQCLASNFPTLISKLVILSSTLKWRQAVKLAMESHVDLREKNVDLNSLFGALMPWILGEAFLNDKQKVTLFKEFMLANPNPQSLEDQKRQSVVLHTFNGPSDSAKIQVPTLVVHGTQDVLVLAQESELLAKTLPNAKHVEIDCGHNVYVEEPAALLNQLLNFLN